MLLLLPFFVYILVCNSFDCCFAVAFLRLSLLSKKCKSQEVKHKNRKEKQRAGVWRNETSELINKPKGRKKSEKAEQKQLTFALTQQQEENRTK